MRRFLWFHLGLILVASLLLESQTTVFPKTTAFPKTTVFASRASFAAPVFNAFGTPCAATATLCTVTISISSGHLIVADVTSVSGTYTSLAVSDSNSDTFSACPQITDAGGGRQAQIYYAVAGAAVTTVTLTVTGYISGNMYLLPFDYTNPGALTTGAIIDQCVGAQNENVSAWTTSASSATTNATDMFHVFMWTNAGTYSAQNFTQREGSTLMGVSTAGDLTTSVTGAQTGTATLSTTGFGPAVGAAFK